MYMQDALLRSCSDPTSELSLSGVTKLLNEGFIALLDETIPAHISVEFLEGVAKVRFSLSVVADILEKQVSSKQRITSSSQAQQLVYTAQNICRDPNVNVIDTTGQLDTTGPIVYLMRLLVRQYGMPCLEKVAQVYSWVIPRELKCTQEVSMHGQFPPSISVKSPESAITVMISLIIISEMLGQSFLLL